METVNTNKTTLKIKEKKFQGTAPEQHLICFIEDTKYRIGAYWSRKEEPWKKPKIAIDLSKLPDGFKTFVAYLVENTSRKTGAK